MVNSGTFDTNAIGQGDRNAKVNRQPSDAVDVSCDSVTSSADGDIAASAYSNDESTPSDETSNKNLVAEDADGTISDEDKGTLCCSVPLDKVQGVLTPFSSPKVEDHKPTRKLLDSKRKDVVRMTLLCLYCERSFASANLRQKHVERIHSAKKNRRLSSRKQNQMTVTPCFYCDKLSTTDNTQKDLFQHLVNEHSDKYFGCLPCEERFFTNSLLSDHNTSQHPIAPDLPEKTHPVEETTLEKEVTVKLTRSKTKPKTEESLDNPERATKAIRSKNAKLKELRSKKLTVKSSRIALNRRESKRLQAISDAQKKKRQKPVERGKQTPINKTEPAPDKSSCINPYPEFDHFYRVKKITDHSIDNLKISSLTFDDVFDKTFFNRIKCNIEENLLHHIDGKLFKNEESESRISNFEKVSTVQQEVQNSTVENFGCELTLNAVTPVASLSLNSQYGEDFESQIEYGAKPSKKKTQTKKDEVHYKYFTRRKFQASILEQTENRDLSKLDMWTQLVIKKRQQKIIDDKKTPKEIQEYTTGDEYKNKIRREELNRILDRRGPFEDLREEASKKAALDKLNSDSEGSISHESFTEVREVLNEILNRVFEMTEKYDERIEEQTTSSDEKQPDLREIPAFLNLRRSSSLTNDGEIDQSDKITLICSSQETENFELPTNSTRRKDELIELSGEWARCRMYICAACGAKLPNMRYLLDHKTIYHQNVWVQHYEFVGNQSELYRHLSIPALGKVGFVENSVQCKSWKRSDARTCTKCKKQCNTLGELHRHILECGGDWTWMLARKKCKYRYGAKSRRKRRGLVVRVHHHKRKTDSTEKKKYKYDGPRQRPSDAETIQRMLANLPAKRSTRKLISLYDGVRRRQKNQELENSKQKKVKCGKVIYSKSSNIKETTEKTINTQKSSQSSNIRSLRSLNRVLSSKILDTTTTLSVKRKLKVLNDRRTRQSVIAENTKQKEAEKKNPESSPQTRKKLEKTEETSVKTSPRNGKLVRKLTVKKLLTGNINIKSFFPVKKRKNKNVDTPKANVDIQTRSKTKTNEPEDETVEELIQADLKVKKNNKLNNIVSINKKKTKKASQEVAQKQELSKNTDSELNKRKRNLKQSFRSVINRVKRLKIDNAPEKVQTDNKPPTKSPFLDEPKQEKDPVKIVIPSTLEAKENLADISETAHTVIPFNETNEDSTVPENIFKLDSNNEKSLQAKGEFDIQPLSEQTETQPSTDITMTDLEILPVLEDPAKLQPITIETTEKPKTLPMISPNIKGKIRKPARGLNDCIAMLTSKLQQKTNENLPQPKPITSQDCILKIPTFKIQNETCEEVALDLSLKTKDKAAKSSTTNEPIWEFNKLTSVERIIENVVNNKLQEPQKMKLPTQYLFNSIDLTIQNVINGHLNQQNIKSLPTRTTVDDIIDYVINVDKVNNMFSVKGKESIPETHSVSVVDKISITKEKVMQVAKKIDQIRRSRSKRKLENEKLLLDQLLVTKEIVNKLQVPIESKDINNIIPTEDEPFILENKTVVNESNKNEEVLNNNKQNLRNFRKQNKNIKIVGKYSDGDETLNIDTDTVEEKCIPTDITDEAVEDKIPTMKQTKSKVIKKIQIFENEKESSDIVDNVTTIDAVDKNKKGKATNKKSKKLNDADINSEEEVKESEIEDGDIEAQIEITIIGKVKDTEVVPVEEFKVSANGVNKKPIKRLNKNRENNDNETSILQPVSEDVSVTVTGGDLKEVIQLQPKKRGRKPKAIKKNTQVITLNEGKVSNDFSTKDIENPLLVYENVIPQTNLTSSIETEEDSSTQTKLEDVKIETINDDAKKTTNKKVKRRVKQVKANNISINDICKELSAEIMSKVDEELKTPTKRIISPRTSKTKEDVNFEDMLESKINETEDLVPLEDSVRLTRSKSPKKSLINKLQECDRVGEDDTELLKDILVNEENFETPKSSKEVDFTPLEVIKNVKPEDSTGKKEVKSASKRGRKKAVKEIMNTTVNEEDLNKVDEIVNSLEKKSSDLKEIEPVSSAVETSDDSLSNNKKLQLEEDNTKDPVTEINKVDGLNIPEPETVDKPKGKKRGRKPRSTVENLNAEKIDKKVDTIKELQIEDLKIKLTKKKRGRKPKALKQDILNVSTNTDTTNNSREDLNTTELFPKTANNIVEDISANRIDIAKDYLTPEQSEDDSMKELITTFTFQTAETIKDVHFSQPPEKGKYLKNLSVSLENLTHEQITSDRIKSLDCQLENQARIKKSKFVKSISIDNNEIEDQLTESVEKVKLSTKRSKSSLSDLVTNVIDCVKEENKTRSKSPKKLLITLTAAIEADVSSNKTNKSVDEDSKSINEELSFKKPSDDLDISFNGTKMSKSPKKLINELSDNTKQTRSKSSMNSTISLETMDTQSTNIEVPPKINNIEPLLFPDSKNEDGLLTDDSALNITSETESELQSYDSWESQERTTRSRFKTAPAGEILISEDFKLTRRSKTPKNVTAIDIDTKSKDTDTNLHVDSLDIRIIKKSKGRNKSPVSNSLERSNADSGFEDQRETPQRTSRSLKNAVDFPTPRSKIQDDSLESRKIKENLTIRRTRSSTNILMSSSESLSKLNDYLDAEVCNILSQSEFNVPDLNLNKSKSRSSSLRNIFDSPSITESSEAESVSPDQKIKRNNRKCKNSKYFTSEESLDKLNIAETKNNSVFNPTEVDFVKPITGKKSKNQTPFITEEYSYNAETKSDSSDVESDKSTGRKSRNLKLKEPAVTDIEETTTTISEKDLIDLKPNSEEFLDKLDIEICKSDQLQNTSLIQSDSFLSSEADTSSETSNAIILEEKIRNAIRQSLLSTSSIEASSTPDLDVEKFDDKKILDVSEVLDNSLDLNPKLSTIIDIDIGTSSRSLRKKSVVNYAEPDEIKEISEESEGVSLENNNNNNECKDSATSEITDNTVVELDEVKLDDKVVEETSLKGKESIDESENYILKENLCKNTLLIPNNGANKNRTKLKPKKGRKKIVKNKNTTVTTNIEEKNSPGDNVTVDTTFLTTIPPLTDAAEKEPPIKIIINKQKARRKSKSIKKVGEKGHNDLFEDFSLVIKKKRIITFSPPDTFSKEDTFPMEMQQVSKVPLDIQEKEDLNDSVQEMDMELDEIPIETSIIETPKLDLALHNKYGTKEEFLDADTVPNSIPVILESNKSSGRKKKSKNNYSLGQKSKFKLPLLKISTKLNKTEHIFEKDTLLPDIINNSLSDTTEEFPEVENSEVFNHTNNENEDSVIIGNFEKPVVIRRSRKSRKKGFKRKTKNHILVEKTSTDVHFQIKSGLVVNNQETSDTLITINNLSRSLESLENLFKDVNSSDKILEEEERVVEKSVVDEIDNAIITNESDKTVIKVSKRGKKKGSKKKIRSKTLSTTEDIKESDDVEATELDKVQLESENGIIKTLKNSIPCYMKVNDVTTKEEIEKIYAFSETEDFELEKPIELPRRLPRKNDSEKVKELEPVKRKQKSKVTEIVCNNLEQENEDFIFQPQLPSEVPVVESEKEDVTEEICGSRKSMRTAKVKALEHIHDEALAEFTDVDVDDKVIKDTKNVDKKVKNKKKVEKPLADFDFHREAPLLEDLVAELDGFEELDNSIERELRAEEELENTQQKDDQVLVEESILTVEENQEPRRSRRGSKKVASYNENDLIDPLIDAIENKRKGRKKDEKSAGDAKQRKLNSDELFDLLKASTNDNIFVPKQQNSFLTNLEDSSRDVNDENFDNIFENISEKSDINKIYNFNEGTENADSFIEEKSRKISEGIEPIFANQDSNSESKTKSDSLESNYCEICNKSFVKLENLIKHRRTLTHIQKLSELEAREAEKSKIISRHEDENSRESVIEPPSLIQADKVLEIESTFKTHSSLKLADIINDVLTKPVIPTIETDPKQFSDLILQNNDTKRYKSLGERKSFDSDTLISTDTQPFESKTQIVEKQISLLENIIENQTVSNYIDDISLSSEKSDIPSEPRSPSVSKPASDNNSFLKPTQYEEISEDSANLRNYDDPKLRKTLNRDEELFLECCSLLKSSSEVSSSYSNKKLQEKKVVGALGLKPIDEPDWLGKKNFIQHQNFEDIDDYSDNSRIPTPLGNSYDDDASNSNTISSNWGMDQSLEEHRIEVNDVRLTFENISKNQKEEQDDFKFEGILSGARSMQVLPDKSSPKTSIDELSDGSVIDNKKMMTKGARKVFEGLKVSIPTEELNLEEVLNYSPKQKKPDLAIDNIVEVEKPLTSPTQKSRNSRKSKPVKKAQVGSNLLFKVTKKKLPSPSIPNKELQKDVYDFEETQDNTDVFTKPDFKAFRNLKSNENESEPESRDMLELDTVAVASSRKSKAQETSTKKKCMIMGRIFKNAAKSKVEDIDDEIRKIPVEELVENYVKNQSNLVYEDVSDQLDADIDKKQSEKPKKQENKKKIKLKGKKRTRTNSESTDDEFSLNKTTKRRTNKKNPKEEDNVINLEQELKECIGVASRKSQRKCTSGKQNVLVEYWSSDDSQFEALLEKQIIEVKPREKPIEKQVVEIPPELPKEEVVQELPHVDNIKKPLEVKKVKKKSTSGKKKPKSQETTADGATVNRRKRAAVNPLYHWSSSSEDEASDLIEIKPLRDEIEDDEDRPVQHGWIVGDSPKKLVTMLAQAKGKKSDIDCVKEQGKKRTNTVS